MLLSICIPTYNRFFNLKNCLRSIYLSSKKTNLSFEICISDNSYSNKNLCLVKNYSSKININYKKNSFNLGRTKNYIQASLMARGEFIWLLGDDDLLLDISLNEVKNLLTNHKNVDFFYINSFNLKSSNNNLELKYRNLKRKKVKKFSQYHLSKELRFFDLIDPKISFDFLGGMYLSIFRKKNWIHNVNILNRNHVNNLIEFSSLDNTFPHTKIYAHAFNNSKAFFYSKPLSINLSETREWSYLYPLVISYRLPELLEEYRKKGLPFLQYIYCKNFALRNFIPDTLNLIFIKKINFLNYINIYKNIIKNMFYPNFYLSILYFFLRKIF
jgi:hypothetical protein